MSFFLFLPNKSIDLTEVHRQKLQQYIKNEKVAEAEKKKKSSTSSSISQSHNWHMQTHIHTHKFKTPIIQSCKTTEKKTHTHRTQTTPSSPKWV